MPELQGENVPALRLYDARVLLISTAGTPVGLEDLGLVGVDIMSGAFHDALIALLGDDFNGSLNIRRLVPRIREEAKGLLLFATQNGAGGYDVTALPTLME